MAERSNYSEKESVWNSKLFKFGVVFAGVGAMIGSGALITVGVVALGGAWAMWRGK